jgi:hypothetical protein
VLVEFFEFYVQGTSKNYSKKFGEANSESDGTENDQLLSEDVNEGVNASLDVKEKNFF